MGLPEEACQAFEAVKQRFLSRENRGAGDRSAPLLAAIAADQAVVRSGECYGSYVGGLRFGDEPHICHKRPEAAGHAKRAVIRMLRCECWQSVWRNILLEDRTTGCEPRVVGLRIAVA
jgi:hypothetical protein